MGKVAPEGTTMRRRTMIIAIGAAVVVLVFVAGFAFVNSKSVLRVTQNARALHGPMPHSARPLSPERVWPKL
jgi:hypothetical protein